MAKTAKEILKSDDDFIETLTEIEEALIIERMELYANQFKPPMSVKVEEAADKFAANNNFNIPYVGAIRERVKEGFIAGWQASLESASVKQGQAEEVPYSFLLFERVELAQAALEREYPVREGTFGATWTDGYCQALRDLEAGKIPLSPSPQTAGSVWVKASERLPGNTKTVYGKDNKGTGYSVSYTKGGELDVEDYDETGDFDAINGSLYMKEGWYENCEQQGGQYDEVWFKRNIVEWLDESSGDKDSEREGDRENELCKEIITLKAEGWHKDEEIERLKELIEKLCESCMPEIDCVKYKIENNL